MKRIFLLGLVMVLGALGSVLGEYTFFTPPGSFAIEISLENSPYLRLPIYQNAITSMTVSGDWILGGTTASNGKSPFIFLASFSRRRLEDSIDIGRTVPLQRGMGSGVARGGNGVFYLGTMAEQAGGSGHLLEVKVVNDKLALRDLGVPIQGEGVFALIADPKADRLYGIAAPSGRFFWFEISTGKKMILEETRVSKKSSLFLHSYALEPEDYLCRRLAVDRTGRIFGSLPVNRLFAFHPATNQIQVLKEELPEGWGRRALGRVDCWALDPNGQLYGGSAAEGQLFRLNPDSGKVVNLGKPVQMPRLKGMAFAADGKLYGVAGGAPGYSHLFSYDPQEGNFRDLGNPRFEMKAPGIEQGIWWRGFQIGSLAVSEDGQHVVLGEEEALSQLMVFPVAMK
jgi:hypothetical protein